MNAKNKNLYPSVTVIPCFPFSPKHLCPEHFSLSQPECIVLGHKITWHTWSWEKCFLIFLWEMTKGWVCNEWQLVYIQNSELVVWQGTYSRCSTRSQRGQGCCMYPLSLWERYWPVLWSEVEIKISTDVAPHTVRDSSLRQSLRYRETSPLSVSFGKTLRNTCVFPCK